MSASCFHRNDSVEGTRCLDKYLQSEGLSVIEDDAPPRLTAVGQVAQDCMYVAILNVCRTANVPLKCKPMPEAEKGFSEPANGFPTVDVLRWVAHYFAISMYQDANHIFHDLVCRLMDHATEHCPPDEFQEHVDCWMRNVLDGGVFAVSVTGVRSPVMQSVSVTVQGVCRRRR